MAGEKVQKARCLPRCESASPASWAGEFLVFARCVRYTQLFLPRNTLSLRMSRLGKARKRKHCAQTDTRSCSGSGSFFSSSSMFGVCLIREAVAVTVYPRTHLRCSGVSLPSGMASQVGVGFAPWGRNPGPLMTGIQKEGGMPFYGPSRSIRVSEPPFLRARTSTVPGPWDGMRARRRARFVIAVAASDLFLQILMLLGLIACIRYPPQG